MSTPEGPGFPAEVCQILRTQAAPYNEWPSVIRRRKIVVSVVLLIGTALLGYSLSREPGDESFIWLTLAFVLVFTNLLMQKRETDSRREAETERFGS